MPISWLDHKPHAIAVYASWPALPSAHATLATGRPATALPGPVLHRLDCTSFRWRLRRGRSASYPAPPARIRTCTFMHTACMGLSLSMGITPFLSSFVIPFFCSTRAASILPPRPHISIAVARSVGQGRRFFSAAEGLSLTDASTAAGCRRSGGWPHDDPRGACHWPRSIARTTLVFG